MFRINIHTGSLVVPVTMDVRVCVCVCVFEWAYVFVYVYRAETIIGTAGAAYLRPDFGGSWTQPRSRLRHYVVVSGASTSQPNCCFRPGVCSFCVFVCVCVFFRLSVCL